MNINYELLNELAEKDLRDLEENKNIELLRFVNNKYLYNVKRLSYKSRKKIVRNVKKEQLLKVVLDFYEQLDPELYEHVKSILLGTNEDFPIVMYEKKASEFFSEDEDNFKQYLDSPMIREFHSNILLTSEKTSEKRVHFCPKMQTKTYMLLNGNIEDIYNLAHELSHTFDLNLENNKEKETREAMAEITPATIELILEDYLIEQGKITPGEAIDRRAQIEAILKEDAIRNCFRIEVAKLKREGVTINNQSIMQILQNLRIRMTPDNLQRLTERVIQENKPISQKTRYITAHLMAPYLYTKYKEDDGISVLKEYWDGLKENDIHQALGAIELKLDAEEMSKVLETKNKYIQELQKEVYKRESGAREL